MSRNFETVVIGLGAMGSAAVYQLAKRGSRVLGIDRFAPPHGYGSSHGETRITRQAIGEGAEYVPLVLRSYEIWEEVERETGKQVLTITGGLIMSGARQSRKHGSDFFHQTVACAETYGIAHRLLEASEIQKQFPQFKLQGNEKGYFEEKAGYLRPELCIEAQLELAQRYGARLALNERVVGFSINANDRVTVKTDRGDYEAEKVILAAGPWVRQFLGEKYRKYFTIYRQILYWFEIKGPVSQFETPNLPIWIWEFGTRADELVYGFPAVEGVQGGLKLASEGYAEAADPEWVSRVVSKQEIENMYRRYVQPRIPGLGGKCLRAEVCLYTVTPDYGFVIDVHPDFPQVLVASPCSGHGFKHSAAIGEALAQWVTGGRSQLDLSRFSFRRLERE